MTVHPTPVRTTQPVPMVWHHILAIAQKDSLELIVKLVRLLWLRYSDISQNSIHAWTNFKWIVRFYADIDNCAPNNPCNNGGECIDEIADFTCKCAEGWTGKTCTESKYQFIFKTDKVLLIFNFWATFYKKT